MFDFTLDMIVQAASNSFIIFCLCNLIIFTIIFGSSKPGSSYYQETEINKIVTKYAYPTGKQKTSTSLGLVDSAFIPSTGTSKDSGIRETYISIDDEDDNDHNNDVDDNDDDDEDDDDGLRRRVEEFIDKVNKEWKEERMRTYQPIGANN